MKPFENTLLVIDKNIPIVKHCKLTRNCICAVNFLRCRVNFPGKHICITKFGISPVRCRKVYIIIVVWNRLLNFSIIQLGKSIARDPPSPPGNVQPFVLQYPSYSTSYLLISP
jgi:hypothetical protein